MTLKFRTAAALLGSIAAIAIAAPSGAQAAQIGQVCNTNGLVGVLDAPNGGNQIYALGAGAGFRVQGYTNDVDWYYGNGNGQPAGYIPRSYINQNSCHW
jgi:hypothetical protein